MTTPRDKTSCVGCCYRWPDNSCRRYAPRAIPRFVRDYSSSRVKPPQIEGVIWDWPPAIDGCGEYTKETA